MVPRKSGRLFFAFIALACSLRCLSQSSPRTALPVQEPGSIGGTVVDGTGAVVAGARVKFSRDDQLPGREAYTGSDGHFFLTNTTPGAFQITVTAAGFAVQTVSGTLHPGESYLVPPVVWAVAAAITEVQVALSPAQVVDEQVKDQEKQRVLGVIPNFYVSYVPDAGPLTMKQKFALAWKTTVDPVSFGMIAVVAGVQQAQNSFSGYGQGAQGYAKRYGASYADLVSGTFIGSTILPSLLKQDPRYFYKGSGSKRSRSLYALANAFVCKGDNGHWQPNYSSILGNVAAGDISNLYYPAENRNGAELTFENGLVGIGATAAANLLQEFVIRKLTSHVPGSGKP